MTITQNASFPRKDLALVTFGHHFENGLTEKFRWGKKKDYHLVVLCCEFFAVEDKHD